jgi:hypothetical protein
MSTNRRPENRKVFINGRETAMSNCLPTTMLSEATLNRFSSNNTKGTVPFSESYDSMATSSQCSHQEDSITPITMTWSSTSNGDEEQASSSTVVRKEGITYQTNERNLEQPELTDDSREFDQHDQSNEASSITHSIQSFLYNTSLSIPTYVSPWQEEKPFDEQSVKSHNLPSPKKLEKETERKVELNNSVNRGRSKGSNETAESSSMCDVVDDDGNPTFLKQNVEIPMNLVYLLSCLVILLTVLGVAISIKFLVDANSFVPSQQNEANPDFNFTPKTTFSPISSAQLTTAPTSVPLSTTATISPTYAFTIPTLSPAKCNNRVSVDQECYVHGRSSVEVDFSCCEPLPHDWVGVYLDGKANFLGNDYIEWSWTCGSKKCPTAPKANSFKIDTSSLPLGTYQVYYMRYDPAGPPFLSQAKSETFAIAPECSY